MNACHRTRLTTTDDNSSLLQGYFCFYIKQTFHINPPQMYTHFYSEAGHYHTKCDYLYHYYAQCTNDFKHPSPFRLSYTWIIGVFIMYNRTSAVLRLVWRGRVATAAAMERHVRKTE